MEKKVLAYFSSLKKQHRIGKAYIFIGENLFPLSLKIAQLVNCKESDYFCNRCKNCIEIQKRKSSDLYILKEEGYIKIDSVRQAQRFLNLKSINLERKILIIDKAHEFLEVAQSAFLKTLEEPPSNSLIILLAARIDNFLPTLLSRCHKIFIPFYKKEESELFYLLLEDFCKKRSIIFENRKEAVEFFREWVVFLRDKIISKLVNNNSLLLTERDFDLELLKDFDISQLIFLWEKSLKILKDLDNLNIMLASKLLEEELWRG